MKTFATILLLALQMIFSACASAQPAAAKPLDPITAIIDAFRTHDVVALGEGNHGNEQGAAFREQLYRDPRFAAVVNDIVVESGNARHQAMMDRYIAGEDVPEKQLRMAWLETTAPNDTWDRAIYADMFRTIRELNQKLPKERQLRVLLGDTPYTFDPSAPPGPVARDDKFTAELVQGEVLTKGRKALIVYGGIHFLRRHAEPIRMPSGELLEDYSIVTLLEKAGTTVFAIWTFSAHGEDLSALQADITDWPRPSLALVKDTTLGVAPFTFYYPKGAGRTMRPGPNGPVLTDLGEAIGGIMQEQVDAVLYIGPKSAITYGKLPVELCDDGDYLAMRAKRMGIPVQPNGPPAAEQLRAICLAAAQGG